MIHLTSTRRKDFNTCPELYRSRWEQRLEPAYEDDVKSPMDAGNALHAGIGTFYSTGGNEGWALTALRSEWGEMESHPLFVETGKYTLAHLEEVMQAYMHKYAPPWDEDVVEVEQRREQTFGDVRYGYKRDVMFRTDMGLITQDTKTTGFYRQLPVRQAEFALSDQQRGYILCARREGHDVIGARMDVVNLDTRYKKVKPEHFTRLPIMMFTEQQLREWEADLQYDADQIEMLRVLPGLDKRWPQRTSSCVQFNKPCPFLSRCMQHDHNATNVANPLQQGRMEHFRVRERDYDD